MRILLATHASLEVGGGEERMLLAMIREFLDQGHEVRVANFSSTFGSERRIPLEDVRARVHPAEVTNVEPLPLLGRILPLPRISSLRSLMESIRWADVLLFGQYYGFDGLIVLLGRLLRRPVVCLQSNALFRELREAPKDAVQEAYARTLGAWLLMRSDVVRVCNSDDLAFLRDRGHPHAVLVYPIGEGFSSEPDLSQRTSGGTTPLPNFASDPRFKVMVAGRMTHQKGIDILADAIVHLSRRTPHPSQEIAFYFAGSSELPAELRSAREHFPQLFVSLGVLPQPAFNEYLARADVVLICSRYESFGMLAAEAQSRGIPVIASNITGLREVVLDGKTGVLVKGWNPGSFAEAILQLRTLKLTTPDQWLAMQDAARKHYADLLSPENRRTQRMRFERAIVESKSTRRLSGSRERHPL